MDKNFDESSKVIIHAQSVGHFIHSNLLYHNLVGDYQSRIACQIYDSPIYAGKMKIGGFEKIMDAYVETAFIKTKIRSPLLERILKVMSIKCFQSKISLCNKLNEMKFELMFYKITLRLSDGKIHFSRTAYYDFDLKRLLSILT